PTGLGHQYGPRLGADDRHPPGSPSGAFSPSSPNMANKFPNEVKHRQSLKLRLLIGTGCDGLFIFIFAISTKEVPKEQHDLEASRSGGKIDLIAGSVSPSDSKSPPPRFPVTTLPTQEPAIYLNLLAVIQGTVMGHIIQQDAKHHPMSPCSTELQRIAMPMD
ncbi:hypothetical protein P7K49_013159, partial [Saguinus oedipus]